MKLSTKIILPIILISALLILLNGCFGVPADESPGYTPGTITGIIAAPCCSTSAEPVSETSGSPEYWCYYCQNTWSLQDGIEVVLTYGEDEVATVFTNKDGEFTFTNVDPGKNYVITAYCPDFDDNRPLVKDVALEIIEGGSFDTKTTDLVSTSLGLVVDFLVLYTEWGPEDISLDEVLADRPSFPNFPKFKKLIYEVRIVVENCEVNLLTDDDVQEALCLAAEEISELDIGCVPGFTPLPGPGPTPGPCDGDIKPVIDQVEGVDQVFLNDDPVSSGSTLYLTVDTLYELCVYATDPDNKLPQPLTYSLSGTKDGIPFEIPMGTDNCYSGTPSVDDVGTYIVYVNVSDGCLTTPWGPVTVVVEPVPEAALSVTKIADPTSAGIGDTITYSYEVENTGDVTLTLVSATDDKLGAVTLDKTTLAPGETTTGTLTYDVVEGDLPGPIVNTVDAEGTYDVTKVVDSDNASVTLSEKNIITFIELEGWENAGCNPGFGSPHKDYHYMDPEPETEPYEIEPDIPWLTIRNPNLKAIHFFINIAADDSPIVTYQYTTSIIREDVPGVFSPIEEDWEWSGMSEEGTLTGPDLNGEYVFSSTCIEIPGDPRTSDYPHHFYIEIIIGEGASANTYMVHIW